MGRFDEWKQREDDKYILVTDNLQYLADKYDSTVKATALFILDNHNKDSDNTDGHSDIYLKERGIYTNSTIRNGEAKDFLDFYQDAVVMHNNEKKVTEKLKQKYPNFYLITKLKANNHSKEDVGNSDINIKESAYCLIAVMKDLLLDPNIGAFHFNSSNPNSNNKPTQAGLADYIDDMKIRGIKKDNINSIFRDANKKLKDIKNSN